MNQAGFILNPITKQQLDAFIQKPVHALLLSGPEGLGKATIARMVVFTLLNSTESDPNQARSVRVIQPQNGAVSIAAIREIASFFALKVPGKQALRRAIIIENADTMTNEAQNAFLKLLEEPPADSLVVLTSSQPKQLLPTIRSRAQTVQVLPPDTATLVAHFTELGHAEAEIRTALLRSGANIAETKRILERTADEADDPVLLVKQALGGTAYDRMLLVDSLVKQKDSARTFVATLATVAIASLQAAARKSAETIDRWKNVLQAATEAQDALERNGNTKIVLTELMLAL